MPQHTLGVLDCCCNLPRAEEEEEEDIAVYHTPEAAAEHSLHTEKEKTQVVVVKNYCMADEAKPKAKEAEHPPPLHVATWEIVVATTSKGLPFEEEA